jgi:hypothetical protein
MIGKDISEPSNLCRGENHLCRIMIVRSWGGMRQVDRLRERSRLIINEHQLLDMEVERMTVGSATD